MLTQKVLQDLLLHYSSNSSEASTTILLHLFKELSEKLERIEALLEKRQIVELDQFKTVQRSMLNKVGKQLEHLEQIHDKTFTDVTAELKTIKKILESAQSNFIGFQ